MALELVHCHCHVLGNDQAQTRSSETGAPTAMNIARMAGIAIKNDLIFMGKKKQ
jgi:hypothetical protein